jgi:hypothetical protein
MEFLEPKEINNLYNTCKGSKIMFEELTKHTHFIINCKTILLYKEIKWFESKNIKLKLLETFKANCFACSFYTNGVLHRDNDLPAVICTGHRYWLKNGIQYIP